MLLPPLHWTARFTAKRAVALHLASRTDRAFQGGSPGRGEVASLSPGLLLHLRPQPVERLVPLGRNPIEVPVHRSQTSGPQLEDTLATLTPARGQTRFLEHAQVLGHRLPRDGGVLGERGDRPRPLARESCDELETGRVTERGEERRGAFEISSRGGRRHRSAGRYAARARCLPMRPSWASHPPSFISNAWARRASGMPSKPDSVMVSSVPSGVSSSSKTTSVVGSFE